MWIGERFLRHPAPLPLGEGESFAVFQRTESDGMRARHRPNQTLSATRSSLSQRERARMRESVSPTSRVPNQNPYF